jgi:CDP-paratose 2-epimerase
MTGSSGLIGSEAVVHYDSEGHKVSGLDNNLRREFFDPAGDHIYYISNLEKFKSHYRAGK